MALILVVDDEAGIREMLRAALTRAGHTVQATSSPTQALQLLESDSFELMITDISMPAMSGVELLRHARQISPETTSIVITAYGSKETAIEAMRLGAVNYLEKPFDIEELQLQAKRALESKSLSEENRRLRSRLSLDGKIIGSSTSIRELRQLVERIAVTDSTVLITGESGVGKEVIARAIHAASARGSEPFVSVNCGAIPAELLESELFGHEKGAFTGANRARRGLVQAASGGTLFLDEIGDMPREMQVKLLRVLQERRIRRVGGNQEIPVDVRVLTATHRNLETLVADGNFREDLYYRINVIRIRVPPLRERSEDVVELARFFVARHAERLNCSEPHMTSGFVEALCRQEWPGNVRQLENVIERAITLGSDTLTVDSIPAEASRIGSASGPGGELGESFDLEGYLEDERKRLMELALQRCSGVQTRAAELLGISFRSFRYFAKKYGLAGKPAMERVQDQPVGSTTSGAPDHETR